MANSGRFGKYGDHKRKAKLRQAKAAAAPGRKGPVRTRPAKDDKRSDNK